MNTRMILSLGSLVIATSWTHAKQSPNFIFILADDMGWTGTSKQIDTQQRNSASDFYLTPAIENLAQKGTCFSNAYAPASMCSPSRASFLTGKSPAQLHLTTPGRARNATSSQKIAAPMHINELPYSEVTIAELLKKSGYATAHYGKWHLGNGGPGEHGFDQHDGDTGNDGPGVYEDPNPKDIFGITQRAQAFMKMNVAQNQPFYVQLSHYAVHSPTKATRESVAKFGKLKTGSRHDSVDFAAMTYDLDRSVAMIQKTIDELNIRETTYIIFMSDNGAPNHGDSLENAPLRGGKGSLWEGGVRVPLIVTGPTLKKNAFCSDNIIGYDLFPTIIELSGVITMETRSVEGVSFVQQLKTGRSVNRSTPLIFHNPHYGKGPKQKPQSALIDGDYKVVKSYEENSVSLFDIRRDLGEQSDLSAKYPEKTQSLNRKMMAYLTDIDAQIPTINKSYDPHAQSSNKSGEGGKSGGFIGRMDKDKDGKVSKNEFSGPSHRFPHLDTNNDGYIDNSEAPTGPPKKRKK